MKIIGMDVPTSRNLGWSVSDCGFVMVAGQAEMSEPFAKNLNTLVSALILEHQPDIIVMERPCGQFANIVGKLWRSAGMIEMTCSIADVKVDYMSPSEIDRMLGFKRTKGLKRKDQIRKFIFEELHIDIHPKQQHRADAIAVSTAYHRKVEHGAGDIIEEDEYGFTSTQKGA